MAAQAEYHRLEDYEEDSPPGEEELLVHVTEGLQGGGTPSGTGGRPETWPRLSPPRCFSLPPDSWHHIKNLDNFFTKISLLGLVPACGGVGRCGGGQHSGHIP